MLMKHDTTWVLARLLILPYPTPPIILLYTLVLMSTDKQDIRYLDVWSGNLPPA